MAIWKINFLLILAALSLSRGFSETFQKLPEDCTISYGDPRAPIHVVEYFSFSCPQCLDLLKNEFPKAREKYIHPGKVYWTFHPDPADLLTLQAMICFKALTSEEKTLLLEETVNHLNPKSLGKGRFLLQEIMKSLGKPQPSLNDLQWIEKTEAFQEAYLYLSQKQVPSDLPTIEVNGRLYKEFPSLKALDQILIVQEPAGQISNEQNTTLIQRLKEKDFNE